MLSNYLVIGFTTIILYVPKALILFCIYTVLKLLIKRKFEFKPFIMLCEIFLILNVMAILRITGIFGEYFGTSTPFDGSFYIDFAVFDEGITMATLLNIVLFIPFGFFSLAVFRKLKTKWIYGILIGFLFSTIIEFLQLFTGRFVQVEDILMNTLGSFVGYGVCFALLELKQQMGRKTIVN